MKDEIRHLIQNAQTQAALEMLIGLNPDARLLLSRFNDAKKKHSMNLIDFREFSQVQSQVIYSALEMLDEPEMPASAGSANNAPSPNSQPQAAGKVKILMLTANPSGQAELNLGKEHSRIAEKIQGREDRISLTVRRAVDKTGFKEYTETMKPEVLHFSGHGEGGAQYGGLVLQNDERNDKDLLSTRALSLLFRYFTQSEDIPLEAVVLNACFSEDLAQAVAEYVPYVVGTTIGIDDRFAIAFSVGFYFKLAGGGAPDYEKAFESGKIEAIMAGAEEQDFVLYINGVKQA